MKYIFLTHVHTWQFDHSMNCIGQWLDFVIRNVSDESEVKSVGKKMFGDKFSKAIPLTDELLKDDSVRHQNRICDAMGL